MTLEFRATRRSLPGQGANTPAYHVMEGEVAVGRIYQANRAWIWTLYSHRTEGAVAPGGEALTLDEARDLFKEAWKALRQDAARVTSGLEF